MFPKIKKISCQKAKEMIKAMPCYACGEGPVDIDHIRTQGAGGGEFIDRGDGTIVLNIWALCRPCHRSKHDKGFETWLLENPKANNYLLEINHPLAIKQ